MDERLQSFENAATNGDLEEVQSNIRHHPFLLDSICAKVTITRDDDQVHSWATPLLIASRYGHVEVAAWLLDWGAEAESANQDSFHPLFVASYYGHAAIVSLLLDRGADIDAPNFIDGGTALMAACLEEHLEVMEVLLNHPSLDNHTK